MTPELAAFARALDACVAEVHATAKAGAGDSRDAWRALVAALAPDQSELPAVGQAANAAEVRAVLVTVAAQFKRRFIAADINTLDDDDAWAFQHRRLVNLVEVEIAAYVRAVVARPSVAAVFARAAAGGVARPTGRSATPVRQLHRCRRCGAPRLSGGEYGACLYCGEDFFRGPRWP